MQAAAPRFNPGARATPLVAVVVLHVGVVAGLLLMPAVRERLASSQPVLVDYRVEARVAAPATPLPRPTLRDPAPVIVPVPTIAVAPEVAVAPPPESAPTISAPVVTPRAAAEVLAAIEPPRYDMSYLNNPAPAYPNISRRMKEQGRVILRVLVSASGTAENVEIRTSSGSERLDHAAIEAVRRWRFAPARRGAETVAAWALVPILFQLDT